MKKGAVDIHGRKMTQGSIKMERYIDELVRNSEFRNLMRRMRKAADKEWPSDINAAAKSAFQRRFENEHLGIYKGYEHLRKRAKRITGNAQKLRELIAEKYGLDGNLIAYAEAKISGKAEWVTTARGKADADLCEIEEIGCETLHPFNPGEEIIYLNPGLRERRAARPVAITIHPLATKTDILDFVEKRWPWIESFLRPNETKGLKYRPQKNPQEVLDFLWSNKHLPSKKIKKLLDKKYPQNKLVYYEINALLRNEAKKRNS